MRYRLGTVLLATSVPAQIDTGIISGRATDPPVAIVPGARVTITQTATNSESVGETKEDGLFRVPSLKPGPYKVSVTAAGFTFVCGSAPLASPTPA